MSQSPPVKVVAKCPKCRAMNPPVLAEEWGENPTSVMVIFVMGCCKSVIGAQLLAKQANAPKTEDGGMLPV